MPGLKTQTEYIERCTIKDGVTIAYGNAVVFTATDGEVDLPAGDNSLIHAGFALEGGTGNAAGTVKIDVAFGGPSLPGIAKSAIAAGEAVGTKGTDGKLAPSTTAGAVVGYAVSNAANDGDRVWVRR